MKTTNLGFPNAYELKIKKAVEGFWKGKSKPANIEQAKHEVLAFNEQVQTKLDLAPLFDWDIYDRLLKTAVIFGITPKRFGTAREAFEDIATYLSIARGNSHAPASPMIKWFNTNYHVVRPEIEHEPRILDSKALPIPSKRQKVCLIGPWTFLAYAINKTRYSKKNLFAKFAQEYAALMNNLPNGSVVQLEEPCFITHGMPEYYGDFIQQLLRTIHLHVYFGSVKQFADQLFALPVAGIGLDFIDGPENTELLSRFPKDKTLIAGVINGRSVWSASIKTKNILDRIQAYIADEKIYISPSCSLIHLPISVVGENAQLREAGNFVFATEKLRELEEIKNGTIRYHNIVAHDIPLPTQKFIRSRKKLWISKIPYPTTTIGSFPQSLEVRGLRASLQRNEITEKIYERAIKEKIQDCVTHQEKLGLDLLVHGEFERNDMVQYFAEHFKGITPIQGWVQSYGTRYTRPPIIHGEIRNPSSFTVRWISYAQSFTKKAVKGMLTGPVTIVQWSYPREDISREAQFYQVAEALAVEVRALVSTGIRHIQIDEPALREGLPLEREKQSHYLFHAVNAFRSVYADVPDNIVIHSHMCFSEFSEIIEAICKMGVDVLSIEDSKSHGRTAQFIGNKGFPGSIGLGVFDVHSPRIPKVDEMKKIPRLLDMDPKRIWINPDCGLKTRGEEAYSQLEKMMETALILRKRLCTLLNISKRRTTSHSSQSKSYHRKKARNTKA